MIIKNLNINSFTNEIKNRENDIIKNFFRIGCLLAEIDKKELWSENYKSLNEYISKNFKFTWQHGYNLIKITKEFTEEQSIKLGVTKCIELIKLPVPVREAFIEEKEVEKMSCNELQEEIEIKLTENEEELLSFVKDPVNEIDYRLYQLEEDFLKNANKELEEISRAMEVFKKVKFDRYENKFKLKETYKKIITFNDKINDFLKKISNIKHSLRILTKVLKPK